MDGFFRKPGVGITESIYELGGRIIEKDYNKNIIAGYQFNYANLKQEKFEFFKNNDGLKTTSKEFNRLRIIDKNIFIPDQNFFIKLAKEVSLKEVSLRVIADEKEDTRIYRQLS